MTIRNGLLRAFRSHWDRYILWGMLIGSTVVLAANLITIGRIG